MANDAVSGQSTGQITCGIERDTLPIQTIRFVRQQLSEWRDDPGRPAEESEDKLNLQLCKFLDSRARNDFPMVRFDHEEYQPARRRIDLSASPVGSTVIGAQLHTIYDPFLVLEGKRLPAPSAHREKEYVTGYDRKTGGIQRFKMGLHGAGFDVAAMIGYVQGGSSPEWHVRINGWILDLASGAMTDGCVWKDGETLGQLEEDTEKGTATCLSVHCRVGGTASKEIHLHHLWVRMTSPQAQGDQE